MICIEDFKEGMEADLREVFLTSIRMTCNKDYSEEQIDIWAPQSYDQTTWAERLKNIHPFVTRLNNKIVGYADVQSNGYIDHFFVHGEYQGKGIGAALMSTILKKGKKLETLSSQVSITAKPFFMRHGFEVLKEQEVWIKNVKLKNFVMEYKYKN